MTLVGSIRHVEHVMGTAVSFYLETPVPATALQQTIDFLHWVDHTFSTYRHDSEICRIADGRLSPDDAARDVRAVLSHCEELRIATDGWFDHRPAGEARPRLDPSGLVKGWSIDRCAEILRDAGARVGSITAGGDVRVIGAPRRGTWRVGICHPNSPDCVAAVVQILRGAAATSGGYARGDHVWQQRTADQPASVTVAGPELGIADALATAVLASGEQSPSWMSRFPSYDWLIIDGAGVVHHTPRLVVDRLDQSKAAS